MRWSLPLSIPILIWSLACNSDSDPASGLFVDLNAASEGDGSECFPLKSLARGFELAVLVPVGHIKAIPSLSEAEIGGSLSVGNALTVEGGSIVVTITGKFDVSGRLVLIGLTIQQRSGLVEPLFTCLGGYLAFEQVEVRGGNRAIIDLFAGIITVTNSRFVRVMGSGVTLRYPNSKVFMASVTVEHCGNLIDVKPGSHQGENTVSLTNVMIAYSGKLINSSERTEGYVNLTIKDSFIEWAYKELISGYFTDFSGEMQNVTVTNSQQVIVGSLIDSSIRFENSTISRMKQHPFDLSAFSGFIAVSNSTISEVTQGPIFLIPFNTYPAVAANISISSTKISKVTTLSQNMYGIILTGLSVSLIISNCEIWGGNLLEGGLFSITAGFVLVSNVFFHDSSSVTYAAYESTASVVVLTNVTMTRLSQVIGRFTCCIVGTDCYWQNVSITQSIDPTKQPTHSFILLWAGYAGTATIRNSYFHNTGRSHPCMGATDGGAMFIYNSYFVDLNNNGAFVVFSDGFMAFDNITFVRSNVTMLFGCNYSKQCFNVSRVRIEGESKVSSIMVGSGSNSISDSEFEGIDNSMFLPISGNLTIRNVTVKYLSGYIWKGCTESSISIFSLKVIDSNSQMLMQMSFCDVVIRDFRASNVTCQNFIMMEHSSLSLFRGEFDGVLTDSFGGLITATSSKVNLDSTTMRNIVSTVSIRIGLILLESSSMTILRSTFREFNSTLVYAIQSPVVISNSEFADGGLSEDSRNRAVLSYGSALWGVSSSVEIDNCRFERLSADDGGALYVTGTGVETCKIRNVTAISNQARRQGGFLYTNQVRVDITNSEIVMNSANQGGGLCAIGSKGELLTQISNTEFLWNSASMNGGAMLHHRSSYYYRDTQWVNNTALYGPNFASDLYSLSVIDNTTQRVFRNFVIEAVSGQLYTGLIVIGCLDELKQVISTDYSSKLTLFTAEANSSIILSTILESKNGTFSIPKITIVGKPHSTVTVFGTIGLTFTQPIFTVKLRDCIAGESYDHFQCKLCTHNTYSFTPSDRCKLCPAHADCPSGYQVILKEGYWRTSTFTDEIYDCVVKELCLGGMNSECAQGHSGVMCAQCEQDHFKANQLQCLSCKTKGVSALKAVLALVISVSGVAVSSLLSAGVQMTHLVVFDYLQSMRILLNYNIYWPESLSYFYSIMGDIGSIGLTAFTDSCLGTISGVEMVYSQLIVSILYFAIVSVVVVLCCSIISTRHPGLTPEIITSLLLYFSYLLLPMLFLRSLQLFPCFIIGADKYLIYDTTVKCWSAEHLHYSLALAAPVLLLCILTPFCLILGSITSQYGLFAKMPSWKFFCLAVFLIRKYALTGLLLFSNALALCTQVSLVIATNITTEISMYKLSGCEDQFFFSLYQSTLISSTLQSFFCVIYFASSTSITDKDAPFSLVNFCIALLPCAYATIHGVYWAKRRLKVHNVVASSSEGPVETIGKPGSMKLEECFVETYIKVPNSSMVVVGDSSAISDLAA